jgi:hypothetical protein
MVGVKPLKMNRLRMKITRQMIHDNETEYGSWTRAQIEALGVKWPPRNGWLGKLEGSEISPENWAKFVAGREIRCTRRKIIVRNAQNCRSKIDMVGICGCGNFEPEYAVHQTCTDCGAPWKVVTYLAALHELFTMLVIARQCQDDGR